MKKTILIIEDEVNLVELLKFRLESHDYNVEVAYDGKDGIKKIMKLKPDLVILDLMLPEMDGYEVCRLSKGNEETKKIPIVVLTARTQKKDRDAVWDAGADDYISKPFEPAELIAKIQEYFNK